VTSLAARIAETLDAAATSRQALAAPFTDEHDELGSDLAYEIQDLVVAARLHRGATIVGAKLGLTSSAKQEQMNVDEPLYGWLTSDMVLPTGAAVDLTAFIHPRVEPEIAFLLGAEVEPPATVAGVLASTGLVFGALEIIDSRYDAFRFRHPDVVADNASSAGVVIGSVALGPEHAGDLRLTGCVVRANGEVVATAAGAAVLGHPAASVAWLINELHRRGRRLPAGSIVLSGALTDAVAISAGSFISAELDGLGTVELRAEQEGSS
jgi:2-oxo-3-hexenedioate decarboxylase